MASSRCIEPGDAYVLGAGVVEVKPGEASAEAFGEGLVAFDGEEGGVGVEAGEDGLGERTSAGAVLGDSGAGAQVDGAEHLAGEVPELGAGRPTPRHAGEGGWDWKSSRGPRWCSRCSRWRRAKGAPAGAARRWAAGHRQAGAGPEAVMKG